jgi:hypothetical protein
MPNPSQTHAIDTIAKRYQFYTMANVICLQPVVKNCTNNAYQGGKITENERVATFDKWYEQFTITYIRKDRGVFHAIICSLDWSTGIISIIYFCLRSGEGGGRRYLGPSKEYIDTT